MFEDKTAMREDINMILEKLDNISYNRLDVTNKGRIENEDKTEQDRTKTEMDNLSKIVKKSIKEEKQYIRNVLNEEKKDLELIRNELKDIQTNIFEKQKEQSIILEALQSNFMSYRDETERKYKKLESANANYTVGIYKMEERLENQFSEQENENRRERNHLNSKIVELEKSLLKLSCLDWGWFLYEKSCYYVGMVELTWEEALIKCASFAAHLAQVDDNGENTFLVNLSRERVAGGYGTWLGGTDQKQEGVWIWSSSEERIDETFSNFKGKEPNGEKDENCLQLKKVESWAWNDESCETKMNYICEKQAIFA